jgi:hypothetical protein
MRNGAARQTRVCYSELTEGVEQCLEGFCALNYEGTGLITCKD